MTYEEKLKQEHPEDIEVSNICGNKYKGCPYHYGYEKNEASGCLHPQYSCRECWNRQMPNINYSELQDLLGDIDLTVQETFLLFLVLGFNQENQVESLKILAPETREKFQKVFDRFKKAGKSNVSLSQ